MEDTQRCMNCKHMKELPFLYTKKCGRIGSYEDAPLDDAYFMGVDVTLYVSPWFGCRLFESNDTNQQESG